MYSYPIDYELFTTEEILGIVEFLNLVESANDQKKVPENIVKAYKKYRSIINSPSIEKQIDRDFEKLSGYSIYKTMNKIK
jgi:uncharacterized protein YktA (UPF0223 family)